VAAEIIDELTLDFAICQTVLLVLTVDREQPGRYPLQPPGRDRDVVDPAPTAAPGAHLPPHDQSIGYVNTQLFEDTIKGRAVVQGKMCFNMKSIVTGSDHVGLSALPAEELERFDQQRFARSGFASERSEAPTQIELYSVDNAETTDREPFEHSR
jgi:hypothetical protein